MRSRNLFNFLLLAAIVVIPAFAPAAFVPASNTTYTGQVINCPVNATNSKGVVFNNCTIDFSNGSCDLSGSTSFTVHSCTLKNMKGTCFFANGSASASFQNNAMSGAGNTPATEND